MSARPPDEEATEASLVDAEHTLVTDEAPSSQHDLDERWTIPWALVESDELRGNAALDWHAAESSLTIGGFSIPRPMLYFSNGQAWESESSCIDTTLEVGVPDLKSASPVPHWSSYESLSPTQRANYLDWLAGDREIPLDDINYVFLYFYGLERYALIDRGDPEEVLRVLMRLLKHYDTHPSFFSSASRLAAFLFATKGIEKLKPAWFQRLFTPRAVPLHHDSLAVALTWLYERGKPLPAGLAFEVARQDIRCPRGASYRSDLTAFRACFEAAYTERFGAGIPLSRAQKDRTWKYRPVNPSLQSWEHFAKLWSVTAPDVVGETAQFAPLAALWRDCQGEGTTPSAWESLVEAHVNAEGRVLIPVRKVAVAAGIDPVGKSSLSLEESLRLERVASDAGFELLPNPRILLRPFKGQERVVLIRQPEEPSPDSEPFYLAGTLLLALGTAMAEADGEVDHIEVLHVSEIVNSLFHFNDHDKHRLGVLRKRLLRYPPKLSSLTRRLRAILNAEERAEAAKFLVGVAGANYLVGKEERLALRRAWRAFNLPTGALDSLLATLTPSAPAASEPSVKDPVDRAALAQLMRDTKRFAVQLGAAMQEIVAVPGEQAGKRGVWYVRKSTKCDGEAAAPVRERDPYCDGLYAMLQRSEWSEKDFIAMGEEQGIFVEGAVRSLDEWTCEIADDVAVIVSTTESEVE